MKIKTMFFDLRNIAFVMLVYIVIYVPLLILSLIVLLIHCVYNYGDDWRNCLVFALDAMWLKCLYSFIFMFVFVLVSVGIPASFLGRGIRVNPKNNKKDQS